MDVAQHHQVVRIHVRLAVTVHRTALHHHRLQIRMRPVRYQAVNQHRVVRDHQEICNLL